MTKKSGPWDSVNPAGGISNAEWTDLLSRLYADGVIAGLLNGLAVTGPNSGRVVNVDTGYAVVGGRAFKNDASTQLAIAANASGNPRKDVVTLRCDVNARTVDLFDLQGTPAASPTLPALSATATVIDVPLAVLVLQSGFTGIGGASSSTVADLRAYAGMKLPPAANDSPIATSQTTASAGFTDLATVGPTVGPLFVGPSGTVLAVVEGSIVQGRIGVQVLDLDGVQVLAPSAAKSVEQPGATAERQSSTFLITGLASGWRKFRAQYAATSGTATFADRNLAVLPL